MNGFEEIKHLSGLCGGSGRESCIADHIRQALKGRCDEIATDSLGSIIAVKKSSVDAAKRIMLDAHIDEIAMMITSITDEGFLSFSNIAGIDKRVLLSHEVTVHCKDMDILGVVISTPPHLTGKEQRKIIVEAEDLYIDIGFDKIRAQQLVSVGDMANLKSPLRNMVGGRICGKALDNRAGAAILLDVFDRFEKIKLPYDLIFSFSAGEELGLRGARTAGYIAQPDECIVVDATHAYTADAKKEDTGAMGAGPMIGIAPILDRGMFEELKKIAAHEGIAHQIEVMSGTTGTNAYSIHNQRGGVKTALISFPLKYMHTGVEMIDKKDYEATVSLICAFLSKRAEVRK